MEATYDDLRIELWFRKRNSEELKWKTRNGQEISIKDMTDTHLENAINYIEQNNYDGPFSYDDTL